MEEKLLYTSNNSLYIIQIEGILKENEIPYIIKIEGVGSYKTISLGSFMSDNTQNIYVTEENLEKAEQLVQIFIDNKNIEEANTEADIEMEEDLKKAKLLRNILIYNCSYTNTSINCSISLFRINIGGKNERKNNNIRLLQSI